MFFLYTEETTDHLISGYSTLIPNGFKNTYDIIGQYLHWKICYHFILSHVEK